MTRPQPYCESARKTSDTSSPKWLGGPCRGWLAVSSFVKNWDRAEKYGTEAYEGSLALLNVRSVDEDRNIETALGAGIEVLAHTYDALETAFRGGRVLARAAEQICRDFRVETRIQREPSSIEPGGQINACPGCA